MFCPFCGHNNAANVKFCGGCGKDLQPFTAPTPAAPKKSPFAPRPTPPKPPKERKPIDVAVIKQVCLQVALAALYLGMAALLLLFMHRIGYVAVDGKGAEDLTVPAFLTFLSEGNFLFHPTTLSATVSVAVPALLYATPLFAVLAAVGVFLKKKRTALHVSCVIVSTLSAAALALAAPLCLWFVPHFKEVLALQTLALAENISGVAFSPLWLIAAVTVVWAIGTSVLLAVVNRKKV